MTKFFGIASILIAAFALNYLWPRQEGAGWNWKQTLVGMLLAPFFYVFGASIGGSLVQSYRKSRPVSKLIWWGVGLAAVLLLTVFVYKSLIDRTPGQHGSSPGDPDIDTPTTWTTAVAVSDEECLSFAKSLESAVASGDLSAFNAKFSWGALIARGCRGRAVPRAIQDDLLNRLKLDGHQLIAPARPRPPGSYTFLRVRTKSNEKWALFRMVAAADAAISYHDLLLALDASGNLVVVDLLAITGGGTLMSESFREALPVLASKWKELRESLSGEDNEFLKHVKTYGLITEAVKRGDNHTVERLYRELPSSVQRRKDFMYQRLLAHRQHLGAEYYQALKDFREHHPDDLTGEFMFIDLYFQNGEYAKALDAIDGMMKAVGGDPVLNWMKATNYRKLKDLNSAKSEAQKGIAAEPALFGRAYAGLLVVLIDRKEFDEAVRVLEDISSKHGMQPDLAFLRALPTDCAEFFASPQYKSWLGSRQRR